MAKVITIGIILVSLACLPAAAQDHQRLEHILKQDCGSCHGMTLKGGLGRPITREAMKDLDPEAIADIILDGIPGTAMPPWRPLLTEEDALWMANYLKKGHTP